MPRKNKKKSSRSKRNTSSHSLTSSTPVHEETDEAEELPYLIRKSDVMGRYLAASRNLTPGSIVMSEDALVIGPCQNSEPMCLGCYVPILDMNTSYRCKQCNWPLCSADCKGLYRKYGHSQEECDLLASSKKSAPNVSSKEKLYNTIVPLRCLLLKNTDKWEILSSMESHNSIRKDIPIIWNTNQVTVVDQIRKEWELTQYSEEEIHTICGIMEVNAFEIGHSGMRLQGLFPSAFLIAHDCVPNTMHTDCNFRLTVRTALPVHTGDMFTLTYAYTLQGTMKRREHLKESKFFDCVCKRCSDATELGTYTSSIRCQQCSSGLLLSSAPLQKDATWHCNSTECPGYSITSESINMLMERINKEIESIDNNNIEELEDFLHRFANVLHPNHYHMLSIKYSLSQLYGKVEGYMIHEMSNALLQRKQDICRDLLKVFDVLEPGMSRLRGVTLYELHAPLMTMTTRDFENQNITKKELKNRLKKVVLYLKEASEILSLEEESSSEGIMCTAAKDALVKMQSWQQIIGSF